MGYATLGFPKGPGIKFRIDPQAVDWNFTINTSVTDTIGGRVVQVLGATLSDLTITGQIGQQHSVEPDEGDSWALHQRFVQRIRSLMEFQSRDVSKHQKMHPVALFTYPPKGWSFRVYLKDIADPDGGSIQMRTGKFSHEYVLTLFIVQSGTTSLTHAGEVDGEFDKARAEAVNSYIARISGGIGWVPTIYNGDFGSYYEGIFDITLPDTITHGPGDPKPKPKQKPPLER